jgi:hypothetical protein
VREFRVPHLFARGLRSFRIDETDKLPRNVCKKLVFYAGYNPAVRGRIMGG